MSSKKTGAQAARPNAKNVKGKGSNGRANGSGTTPATATTSKPATKSTVAATTSTAPGNRPSNETLLSWYKLMHLGRLLDD